MKKIYALMLVLACLIAGPIAAAELQPQEIVAKTDELRNPGHAFSVTAKLTEYDQGKARDSLIVQVYSKRQTHGGQYRSLVRFHEPTKDRGKLMLRNGTSLWFYDPSASTSVRISPQQRLLGQAANGDVMTVDLALDYRANNAVRESIEDGNRQPRDCYRIDLTAQADGVTYQRIEYWIDRNNYQPVKGKFYADSGRLLKIAYYRNYRSQLNAMRPTEVIIIDGVNPNKVTRLQFSNYQYVEIPEAWLQREFLPQFKTS
ncbi:MAG: outer membrane lipoprotein-sorting protein [Gammaproteobacteria bacterium]|nr:outer membrane lipoprotein-sorting protein [Gammaproteobacteria bacterium]